MFIAQDCPPTLMWPAQLSPFQGHLKPTTRTSEPVFQIYTSHPHVKRCSWVFPLTLNKAHSSSHTQTKYLILMGFAPTNRTRASRQGLAILSSWDSARTRPADCLANREEWDENEAQASERRARSLCDCVCEADARIRLCACR